MVAFRVLCQERGLLRKHESVLARASLSKKVKGFKSNFKEKRSILVHLSPVWKAEGTRASHPSPVAFWQLGELQMVAAQSWQLGLAG